MAKKPGDFNAGIRAAISRGFTQQKPRRVDLSNLPVLRASGGLASAVEESGGGGEELEEAPEGFAYLVNADGEYMINADGEYLLAKV